MKRPRPRRQLRKTTAVRRTEIAEAALEILVQQGPRRLTAQLIASKIGITAGALFRHFPTMDAIVEAIISQMESILFADAPPEAADPLERLRLFFSHRVQTILANPDLARVLFSDLLAQVAGEAKAEPIEEFKRRSRAYVLGCLCDAKRDGTLAATITPEVGTVVVLGAILSLTRSPTWNRSGIQSDGDLSKEVWAALELMLRSPGPAGKRSQPPKRPKRRFATDRGREKYHDESSGRKDDPEVHRR